MDEMLSADQVITIAAVCGGVVILLVARGLKGVAE
jgi:hypothetical protein